MDYRFATGAVSVNLTTGVVSGGHAAGDTLADANTTLTGFQSDFEAVLGSTLADTLTGDSGANTLEGGAGADLLDGGAGEDWLSYAGSAAGVSVNLATGAVSGDHAASDSITGFEAVRGTGQADTLTGDSLDNTLEGRGGADVLSGGAGADWLDYHNSNAGVSVNLATGVVSGGHAAGDTLNDADTASGFQTDFEAVLGGDGADTLTGSTGADTLDGGDGADTLSGGGGNDSLIGGAGADTLTGGADNDTLVGGAGGDSLVGGAGSDWGVLRGSEPRRRWCSSVPRPCLPPRATASPESRTSWARSTTTPSG